MNFQKLSEKVEREGGGEGERGSRGGAKGRERERERQERWVMRAERERSVQNRL